MPTIALQVLLPSNPGCPQEVPFDSEADGAAFRHHIAEVDGESPEALTLFFRNMSGDDGMRKLEDGATLVAQGVADGALVSCMVSTVLQGSAMEDGCVDDVECMDFDDSHAMANDAEADIRSSAASLVDNAFKSAEAIDREANAGLLPPRAKILPAPQSPEEGGAMQQISAYYWSDRRAYVKVYIAADSEADVVAAAGDGNGGNLEATFAERGVILTVRKPDLRYVLDLRGLAGSIRPDESRCSVEAGKKIVLQLRKVQENETWHDLLVPRWVTPHDDED